MRILFVQPSMSPPGGGNGVAAWMLQALKDVTVLTWTAIDLDAMNRFWGTALKAGDFRTMRVPAAVRRIVDALPLPLSLLRTAIMLRMAQRLRAHYDVPVTANNEADFGTVGVQYVHYPWNFFPRPAVDYRWYHLPLLLPAYYALCNGVSGFTAEGMHRNVTLVNSDWTGRLAHRRYGFVSHTVYPPVTAEFPDVPWEARQPGFVCVGRIAPGWGRGLVVGTAADPWTARAARDDPFAPRPRGGDGAWCTWPAAGVEAFAGQLGGRAAAGLAWRARGASPPAPARPASRSTRTSREPPSSTSSAASATASTACWRSTSAWRPPSWCAPAAWSGCTTPAARSRSSTTRA